MNLDDLTPTLTANRMAQLLKKHFGIKIPSGGLTEDSAKKLLTKVQRVLTEYRNSANIYGSEHNQKYNALLMTEQYLNTQLTQLNENKIWTAVKQSAAKVGEHLPKKYYGSKGTSWGDIKNQFATDKTRVSKTSRVAATSTSSDFEDLPSSLVMQSYKNAKKNPKQINPNDAAVLFTAFDKMVKKGKVQFNESKRLLESAMADAEVVLAAKDIADRFQDMVETLGKMVNEELPALAETIRDTMGAEQADAYTASATETINAALETIRGSKDSLDSAARTLAGEEQPIAEPLEPTAEPGADELDQIPPTASGDDQEPLGRGKR
jgi:hypothetical protein